jgi:large repetitive protein
VGLTAVTVTTPCGTTPPDAAGQFTYCAVPLVLGVRPDHGYATGGASVIISGGQFVGTTSVMFGDTPAASFHVDANYHITAPSPPHALGTVDMIVTNACGSSAIISSDQFTFEPTPYP